VVVVADDKTFDPTLLRTFLAVANGLSFTRAAEQLGLSQPTVSKHLTVLRRAGLVTVRRDAQRRYYRLEPQPLAELDSWLAPYRALWQDALDRLGDRLDTLADADHEDDDRKGTR
jgi:DNA-binding transcriptional ArsR family regulator